MLKNWTWNRLMDSWMTIRNVSMSVNLIFLSILRSNGDRRSDECKWIDLLSDKCRVYFVFVRVWEMSATWESDFIFCLSFHRNSMAMCRMNSLWRTIESDSWNVEAKFGWREVESKNVSLWPSKENFLKFNGFLRFSSPWNFLKSILKLWCLFLLIKSEQKLTKI